MRAVTIFVTALLCVATTVYGVDTLLIPDPVLSNPWSLPSALGTSCTGLGPDGTFNYKEGKWYIDRSLESVCGPRQVFCKNGVVFQERYCSSPQGMFVADFNADCYMAGSAQVTASCGVTVACTESEMRIEVDEKAIWYQTSSQLQLNTNHADCKASWVNGKATFAISLGEESDDQYWSKCGIQRTINSGLDVSYRTDVMRDLSRTAAERYTEQHNAMVTREKCFMIHAKCTYAANGYVTGSFRSAGANAITEEDEQAIDFDLNFMDDSYTSYIGIPSVYTNDPLYARGEIKSLFHPKLKASLRSCWATNFPNAAAVTAGKTYETYNLVTQRCADDSTFFWQARGSNLYVDDYTFNAFRFFSDANNYEQDIWVHCTIVACDASDSTTAYCNDQCSSQTRRRRALDLAEPSMVSKMTEQKITHNARFLGDHQRFFNTEPSAVNSMFAYGLFAVGGVVAVASVALGIILLRGQYMNEKRYKLVQVNA
jgi:hypothetical protein